jgi:hypothetical protein
VDKTLYRLSATRRLEGQRCAWCWCWNLKPAEELGSVLGAVCITYCKTSLRPNTLIQNTGSHSTRSVPITTEDNIRIAVVHLVHRCSPPSSVFDLKHLSILWLPMLVPMKLILTGLSSRGRFSVRASLFSLLVYVRTKSSPRLQLTFSHQAHHRG